MQVAILATYTGTVLQVTYCVDTRGEHFRHSQNLRNSEAHIARSTSVHASKAGSLPIDLIFGWDSPTNESVPLDASVKQADPTYKNDPKWREKALSLLYSQVLIREVGPKPSEEDDHHSVPSLTQLCLQVLLDCCPGSSFAEDLIPWLPSHLRRELMRWTAIHAPLSTTRLYALCEPEGHVDGELIVVGPQASLRNDYFQKERTASLAGPSASKIEEEEEGEEEEALDEDEDMWDSSTSSGDQTPNPITILAVLHTTISIPTLLTFPPTLTHLFLLHLSLPTAIYRLTRICPQLEVLDLSFNRWLRTALGGGGDSIIDRVEWKKWSRLRVLGLRECGIEPEGWEGLEKRVNLGRWEDVEIVHD